MLEFIDQSVVLLFTFAGVTSFLGYSLLIYSGKTPSKFLRKWLYVPARKSKTNAVQLGGLPLSLSVLASFFVYLLIIKETDFFPLIDRNILRVWVFSAFGIVIYGYLDDKFEFRPVVKLSSQIFWMFVFSFFSSMLFLAVDSRMAFILTFGASLIVINGSNLLDGLDSLTVKNTLSTYIVYLSLGIIFKSYPIIILSILMVIPVGVFWFFNKEPSRIHLGEIGGTFLGFSYILLSSLAYKWIGYSESTFSAFSFSIIPLSLPVVEVLVSTLRRLYSNKSMMKGDQMHVHHILNKYFKFSHSKTGTIIGSANLCTMSLSILLAYYTIPFLGVVSVVFLQAGGMVFVGRNYWKSDSATGGDVKSIFSSLRKKNITVIETSNVENFKLTIVENESRVIEDREIDKKAS